MALSQCNFHHKYILPNLILKQLFPKINVKNLKKKQPVLCVSIIYLKFFLLEMCVGNKTQNALKLTVLAREIYQAVDVL